MRIRSFKVQDTVGIDAVEVSDLSDVVVFAGPNGVGKTRLINALIGFFREPRSSPSIELTLDATYSWERDTWGQTTISTSDTAALKNLRKTLQRNQKRNRYRSTVLNFDSNRAITQIRPYSFSWDIPDPFEVEVGWDLSYNVLRDRFQDVTDSLFQLVEGQRRKISSDAYRLRASGASSMPLDFPDPIKDFKEAFYRLLAPKELVDLDVKSGGLFYKLEGKELPIDTLSSGEREVMNIVFDFILRNPSDCIVFFDEPELHLHPELSYRLLQTLASIGERNQFVFCTHSPEIITASIENSVVFLKRRTPDHSNQALTVQRDDATHHALNLLGQSVGIISLGKRLVLIEGNQASLDKQTYGAILRNEFPELVLVPAGGKSTIKSFEEVRESVLNQTIWGVEFFMLCDRDAEYEIGERSIGASLSDRLKVLPRYHLENYFLDEFVLAAVFKDDPPDSWLRDPIKIQEVLESLGRDAIPYAIALKVASAVRESIGNISIMPKGIDQNTSVEQLIESLRAKSKEETDRIQSRLNIDSLGTIAEMEHQRLIDAFGSDGKSWKSEIPGRLILNRFAGLAKINVGRLKNAYLREAQEAITNPFADIKGIFQMFSDTGKAQAVT